MAIELSLDEKIAEMQLKVNLLEGEMRAYDGSVQVTIKQNKEIISHLRKTNKELHKQLVEFHAATYRTTSGQMSVATLKEESMSKMKQLNVMKHTTQVSRQHLEDLKLQYQTLKPGHSKAEEHGRKTQEDDRKRRGLDSSLMQTQVKFQEAEDVARDYFKIKNDLQLESLSFQNQMDSLEAIVLEKREELCKLQDMNNNALLSAEAAERELQQLEEVLSKEHEDKEGILDLCRERVKERKAQVETTVEKALHTHRKTQQRAIFRFLKDISGVTDVQEFVETFVAQGETVNLLEKTKAENQTVLRELNKEKQRVDEAFEKLTSSLAAKRTREQNILQGPMNKLRTSEDCYEEAKLHLKNRNETLANVHTMSQGLGGRLQYVILDEDRVELERQEAAELEAAKAQAELEGSEDAEQQLAEDSKVTEKESWMTFMVKLLTCCETKLGQLQDEVLAKEAQKRKKEVLPHVERREEKWKATKREKQATEDYVERLTKDRKSK